MKNRLFQTYKKLKTNQSNFIVFFEGKNRIIKSFKEFYDDISINVSRLNFINNDISISNVAIIGPTSYHWMVLDYACIMGGYKSVAIPESYSEKNIKNIYNNTSVDLTLCDFNIKDKVSFIGDKNIYYFNSNEEIDNKLKFQNIPGMNNDIDKNIIREDYTIVFSSGTSEKVKKINWSFTKRETKRKFKDKIKLLIFTIGYKLSFWSKKGNKVIIFMPFSHPINRAIAMRALSQKINIIISDPINCFKHIITEKPNIMFAVPPIYEAMAQNIKLKTDKFTGYKRILFQLFNRLKINALRNNNPIKKLFSAILFKKIKKIFGGKADYFVTGSAPIDPKILKVFYSIGIKVYEAYGQTESVNIMNSPRNFRIGSVGRPKKGTVKISDEGELLLKYNEKFHSQNKDILNIKDNWIYSGDLAYIDKDGFIFIRGRKDDTIILENGKKINPFTIESKLTANDQVKHAIVFSQDKLKLKAVINHSASSNVKEIFQWIKKVNSDFSSYERIQGIFFTNDPFAVENGLLTSTLKPKRKSIIEKFGQEKFETIM